MIFVFGDRSKVIPCKGDRRKKRQKEQVTAAFDIYCHPTDIAILYSPKNVHNVRRHGLGVIHQLIALDVLIRLMRTALFAEIKKNALENTSKIMHPPPKSINMCFQYFPLNNVCSIGGGYSPYTYTYLLPFQWSWI